MARISDQCSVGMKQLPRAGNSILSAEADKQSFSSNMSEQVQYKVKKEFHK